MFKVSSTCERNSSQSWREQSISMVVRAAMKCSLNLAMARLAAFARWLCRGMSWVLIALDWMYLLTAAEHSLSPYVQCRMVATKFSMEMTLVNASTMEASVQDGMAQRMIALRS